MLSVTQTTEELVIVDAAGTLTREDYEQFEAVKLDVRHRNTEQSS